MILDSSIDRLYLSEAPMNADLFSFDERIQLDGQRYRRDCTFSRSSGVVASPSGLQSASSSRLAREPKKRTLMPVQLRIPGL